MTRLFVRLSVWCYRIALFRYPRSLRERFGRDMLEAFEALASDLVARRGLGGLVEAWWICGLDLARPLPAAMQGIHGGASPRESVPATRNETARTGAVGWLEDLGFAWRSITRNPAFAFTVIAVLGAGIGLNTTVFSVVNAYLLRPLPFPEPDRLVTVQATVTIGWPELPDVFEKRVASDLDVFMLFGDAGPEMALGALISGDFLDVYGVEPVLGRRFSADEVAEGGASVAMISHRLWQQRYGGDPSVLGRAFQAYVSDRQSDVESFTIVGVLPSDFWHFNDYTDILAPLRTPGNLYMGRLHEGVPLERAEQAITDLTRASASGLPADFRVRVSRTRDLHVASVKPTLVTLQAAVLLVFLIALANAAVLLLVRSARRERELGIRRALGAGGGRLVRQLLAEGMLLAGGAGAVGLALGAVGLDALRVLSTVSMWRTLPGGADALRLDVTVVTAMIALCAVTAAVFGLVPLVSVARRELVHALAGGGRGGTDTVGRRRTRGVMVAAEVALSLALLTGAGLLVQSALNLQGRELGFEPARIFRGNIGLPQVGYPEAEDRIGFFERVAASSSSVPGVESVAMGTAVPWNPLSGLPIEAESGARGEGVDVLADERYFEVLGIDLVQGRTFSSGDVLGGELVAIVSERLAADLWPGLDPLGRRLRIGPSRTPARDPPESRPWTSVVGVVADVWRGVGQEDIGGLYRVYRQDAPRFLNLVVRRQAGVGLLVPEIQAVIAEVDPEVALYNVYELDDRVQQAMAPSRFMAALFGTFAALALVLSVVGLYAVMAYAAREHRNDVAIRMALGATSSSVAGLFLRQAIVLLAGGLAAGAVGGRFLGAALAGQLHGIEPDDPATLIAVTALLGGTALAAAWLPARRAAGVSPMIMLRDE